jgi:hypothetical protein
MDDLVYECRRKIKELRISMLEAEAHLRKQINCDEERVLVALCMLRQWAQKQIVTLRLTIMAQQHIARGALNERFATSDGHGGS